MFVGQFDVQSAIRNIENDGIAVGDCGDGSTMRGFRSHVAGHQSVSGATEAAVSEKCYGVSKSSAYESRGDRKHFAHAGTALRSFIANDYHVASFDFVLVDVGERSFFIVEDARWATEIHGVVSGNFYDATFGREIAFENHQAASGLERILGTANDFLFRRFFGGVGFLLKSFAGNGDGITFEQAGFEHPLRNQCGAAGCEQVGCDKAAAGLEVGDDRSLGADSIEVVDRERKLGFVGDGQQMQHGIG